MQLQDLQLTDDDFKMIIDGLKYLPNKDDTGELMIGLLDGLVGDKTPEAIAQRKRDREIEMRKRESAKEALRENIIILQGKLLMFKRHLMEEGALKQTNDILNK